MCVLRTSGMTRTVIHTFPLVPDVCAAHLRDDEDGDPHVASFRREAAIQSLFNSGTIHTWRHSGARPESRRY
jgi:hypothetical protein